MISKILICLGWIFIVIGVFATPVSVIYGLYSWVVVDVAFKIALWAGVLLWIKMVASAIVGVVLRFIGSYLEA